MTQPTPKTILTIGYYRVPFATVSIVMIDEKKVIVSRQRLSHPDTEAARRKPQRGFALLNWT